MPEAPDLLDQLTNGSMSLEDIVGLDDPAPEPTPEPAAEPEADPVEAQEPEAADDAAEPEAEPDGEPSDDQWVAETGKRFGIDLSKYKTRDDAIAGLVQAAKTVGARDEYAQLGRAIYERYAERPDELRAIVAGQQPQQQQPAVDPSAVQLPKSYEEVELLKSQVRVNDEGEMVPAPGAPKDAVVRYQAYTREMARKLHDLTTMRPEEFRSKYLGIDPAAQAQQFQQQLAAIESRRAEQDWIGRHATDLYVEGTPEKGMTPLGAKAAELYGRVAGANEVERMENALYFAKLEMPKAAPRKPSQAARHRPAVAPAPATPQSIRERIEKAPTRKDAQKAALAAMLEGYQFSPEEDEF